MGSSWPPAQEAAEAAQSPWDTVLARLRYATRGEFDIGRELGRGGMAAVFLAHDLALNRKVAIKVMSPGLLMGAGMIERFRQEAVTIANLQHAHIVTVHAVRHVEDLHFFVMQFIEGQSLEGVLRGNPALPLEIVRPMLYQVGTALAYAHRRGVIHRDIKPGNILLSGDGDALVTDFGIAKVAAGPTRTMTGMVVGTPSYMSPEQCHAEELDGASDQYSLGIVAFQMLSGRVPFSGSTFAIMHGHTTLPVPSLREIVPDVPESVDHAVMRMLAKKPSERFPTFAQALQALSAHPLSEESPLRAELIRLAAVEERRAELGDLLRTPISPVPSSRAAVPAAERPSESPPAPVTPAPVTPAPPPPVVAVLLSIVPLAQAIEPGDQIALRATLSGPAEASMLRWSVENPLIAEVDPVTGLLLALSPGSTTVRAVLGTAVNELAVQVSAPSVATVRVMPARAEIRSGEQLELRVEVLDRRGQPLVRIVTWSARGEAVHVDPLGTVTALMTGSGAITAACGGVQCTVPIEVRPLVAAPPFADAPPSPLASVTEIMGAAITPPTPVFTPEPQPPDVDATVLVPRPPAVAPATPAATGRVAESAVPERATRPLAVPIAAGVLVVAVVGWLLLPSSTPAPPDAQPKPPVNGPVQGPDTSKKKEIETPPVVVVDPPSTAAPTLRVTPPASAELRPAQTLRLRATLLDRATGATVGGAIRYLSSDPRVAVVHPTTGEVRAVTPGRVTISVDGGAAGRTQVRLTVVESETRVVVTEDTTANHDQKRVTPPPIIKRTEPVPPGPSDGGGGGGGIKPGPGPVPVSISQAQLASDARTAVESFARAIESRNLGSVRSVLPGISSQYASELSDLFEASKSVRVSVNSVSVRGAGSYDATPGSRTTISVGVTFRVVPIRGNPLAPSDDSWPMTLQRDANGWKIVQVSTTP